MSWPTHDNHKKLARMGWNTCIMATSGNRPSIPADRQDDPLPAEPNNSPSFFRLRRLKPGIHERRHRTRKAKAHTPRSNRLTARGSGTLKARLSIAQRGAKISTLDRPEAKEEVNR